MEAVPPSTSIVLNNEQTCSHFIAAVSAREMPDNRNVQMCVVSVGFDVEGIVAELLFQRMMQSTSRRVYCVVVPDNLPPGSVTRIAKAIERHLCTLQTKQASTAAASARVGEGVGSAASPRFCANTVLAIEEGTGTKERCAVFQSGAVVLLTSRSLCADLLHRRLAVELVGMAVLLLPHAFLSGVAVHEALAPQTAFCAELLLRNSRASAAAADRHAPPPVVVLSDAPVLMQSLVQRHHVGAERFVQQLHIGDIQLFPRFRLDFVRHFEQLSRSEDAAGRRALDVDRVVAPVSASVLALDSLLSKIALETLQELQRLEQQLHHHQQQQAQLCGAVGGQGGSGASPAARRAAAAAEADEGSGAQRFMPRARLTATTLNGHLDYSGYPRPAAGSASYVRRGWREARDDKGIWFSGISEAAALAVDFGDLDSDLRSVVRRHEAQWPYRLLVESFIDVRRLRRATRGTAFSFLLHLESVLEKRMPQRSVYGTGSRPPAALWTLSSHFHDVVTVATHRIGTVVFGQGSAPPQRGVTAAVTAGRTVVSTGRSDPSKAAPHTQRDDAVVVVDSSEEEEAEEGGGGGGGTAAPPPAPSAGSGRAVRAPQLLPNTEEQESDVEVVVRLVMSWCRTALRRRDARQHKEPGGDDAFVTAQTKDAPAPYPTLLLLTFGAGAVVRYTERLTHDLAAYQRLQLSRFMHLYQTKYGVALTACSTTSSAAGDAEAAAASGESATAAVEHQLQASLFECDSPEDALSDDDAAEDDGAAEGGGAGPSSQAGPSALYGEAGASAFHQALLTQVAPLEGSSDAHSSKQTASLGEVAERSEPANAAVAHAPLTLAVERVRAGAVTLRPVVQGAGEVGPSGSTARSPLPRILILDGGQLSASELTMLLDGSHEALSFHEPSAPADAVAAGGESVEAVGGAARLRVERLLLSRQQLSVLRQLEMAQDSLPAECLRRLKVQLITTSLAEVDFKKQVQAEQVAFESLAHTKATLTGTLLVDQTSLRLTEEALESGLQVARRRGPLRKGSAVARLGDRHFSPKEAYLRAPPCILFDEREFRSTLPYDLFKRGMDLVPLTLTTADYVLSPEYAVERKSVRDYLQSVITGRIQHQLAALSRRYDRPLCLIEFHRGIPFRLLQARIYGRTARLMAGYPRVGFVWARSPAHAAGMLVTLKKTVAVDNVDPSDPSLTGSAIEPGGAGEAGGAAATAAEREAAHYAARVLSRFPGVTHQNAPRVMQLCGSLIGLATISLSSLAEVMGEEDADKLYTFLHTPFHERVD